MLHLPSDLKNWECLTYSEGNYDELKNKVIKYFSDNYHYNLKNETEKIEGGIIV